MQGLVVVSPKDHIVDVAIAVQRYCGAHDVKRFVLGLIRADDVPGARAPELVHVASYSPWLNLITGGGIGCVSLTNPNKVPASGPHRVVFRSAGLLESRQVAGVLGNVQLSHECPEGIGARLDALPVPAVSNVEIPVG